MLQTLEIHEEASDVVADHLPAIVEAIEANPGTLADAQAALGDGQLLLKVRQAWQVLGPFVMLILQTQGIKLPPGIFTNTLGDPNKPTT